MSLKHATRGASHATTSSAKESGDGGTRGTDGNVTGQGVRGGSNKTKRTAVKRDILAHRKRREKDRIQDQWNVSLVALLAARNVMIALNRTKEVPKRTARQAAILHQQKATQYVASCTRWLDHWEGTGPCDDVSEEKARRTTCSWPSCVPSTSHTGVRDAPLMLRWNDPVRVELVVDGWECRCHLQCTGDLVPELVLLRPSPPLHQLACLDRHEVMQLCKAEGPQQNGQPKEGGRQKKKDSEKLVRRMVQAETQRLNPFVGGPTKRDDAKMELGVTFPREQETMVADLISTLLHFQIRAYKKDPYKAKKTRRLVLGLREVTKAVRLKKAKLVILARNLEVFEEEDGLGNQVSTLVGEARANGIFVVLALTRAGLGKILRGGIQMGAVAVVDFSGAEEKFRTVMSMARGDGA